MPLSRRQFVVSAASLAAGAAPISAATSYAAPDPERQATRSISTGGAEDPLAVRHDFPIARDRHYLNSAYITPVPNQVVAAGRAFVESKAARPIPLGDMLRKTDEVRAQFARLINAGTDEIGFLFSTSEGENVVANGLDLRTGDNVVIDELHYETEFVLYSHLQETRGVEMRVARHRAGRVDLGDVEPLVDRRTRLVSVAWVSHQNGFRHDMRPLADLAHRVGAVFYTDAIQAVGMFPIDVKAAGVDALCCGTYKWVLGSFGVAPFYIRRELLDRIRPDRFGALHVEKELSDHRFQLYRTAKRFDYATLPFSEIYQLGAGLEFLQRVGVDRIEAHTVALAQTLRAGLAALGYRLFTPEGNRSSIVTYYVSKDAATLTAAFERASIDVTVRGPLGQVRVSPALFNTHDDIARFLEVARQLV
ncbi:MAG TPA: aminotransferase class V-fold PLP-dependent enzyme [Vicinamibacterales bacterium]|nr:aminotransferase class V-fold PLP-dependent enzyme [Vicinamibacterales bacterium]